MKFKEFWEKNKSKVRDSVRSNSHLAIYELLGSCWYHGFEANNNAKEPTKKADKLSSCQSESDEDHYEDSEWALDGV